MKKILLVPFIAIFFVSGLAPIFASDEPAEQYVVGASPNASDIGVQFEDISSLNTVPTLLTGGELGFEQYICESVNDPRCAESTVMRYKAFMPPCSVKVVSDCIQSFYAINADGTQLNAILDTQIGSVEYPYKADAALNLPGGGFQTIWKLPGLINVAGNDLYALSFARTAVSFKDTKTKKYKKFPFGIFRGGIFPISMVSGNLRPNEVSEATCGSRPCIQTTNGNVPGPSEKYINGSKCVVLGFGKCAIREGFSADTRYGVVLRFSMSMAGWMHGRTLNSSIQIKSLGSGSLVTVEGNPARVPFVGGWASPALFGTSLKGLPSEPGRILNVTPAGEKSMQLLNAWMPVLGDKAMAMPSNWIIRTLDDGELAGANKCIKEDGPLSGFVTTNSTTYSAGPPVFNKQTMSLDYKLAAPHFTSTGEEFKGSYVISMRSDVARCFYGFTKAPMRATVSIISAKGENTVATEAVSEKNGWLTLAATGFTFSNPTIRVRLTQPGAKKK